MKVDWKLYKNNILSVENNNIFLQVNDNELIYNDLVYKGIHIINLDNKTYLRKNEDTTFKIDFINKTCNVLYGDKEFSMDISCEFYKSNEEIRLIYYIDEEKLEIKIDFKEEK